MRGGMFDRVRAAVAGAPAAPAPVELTEVAAKSMDTQRQQLTDLYTTYCPDKLPEIDTLVQEHGYAKLIAEVDTMLNFLKHHGASYNASTCEISPSHALVNRGIIDVSPLATLTSLTELALNKNQIMDVTPLATLTSLKSLHLGSNQIVDKTSLNHLKARINW